MRLDLGRSEASELAAGAVLETEVDAEVEVVVVFEANVEEVVANLVGSGRTASGSYEDSINSGHRF